VEEDGPHPERLLEVAVASLDPPLLLVDAQQLARPEVAGEVGGERGEPIGERGLRDRALVAPPAKRGPAVALAAFDPKQPLDRGKDAGEAAVDLRLGLVVAPAEPALDARQGLLGLAERALACGGDLARSREPREARLAERRRSRRRRRRRSRRVRR
jgi:hypothetical protein